MRLITKIGLCLSLALSFDKSESAGPIAHVYLAEKFLQVHPKNQKDSEAFIIGTLYPDIRYISKVHRKETHIDATTLQDVLNEPDPFIAGAKFHTYVDKERNIYVIDSNVYPSLLPKAPKGFRALLIKLIEDEYLLPKINWQKYVNLLTEIHQGELSQGISVGTVKRWHYFLSLYFRSSPRSFLSLMTLLKTPLGPYSQKDAEEVLPDFKKAMTSPAFQDYVDNLVEIFNKELGPKFEKTLP